MQSRFCGVKPCDQEFSFLIKSKPNYCDEGPDGDCDVDERQHFYYCHQELKYLRGGGLPETNEIVTHICSCHNFFPLSSVQIIIILACCLLCVL